MYIYTHTCLPTHKQEHIHTCRSILSGILQQLQTKATIENGQHPTNTSPRMDCFTIVAIRNAMTQVLFNNPSNTMMDMQLPKTKKDTYCIYLI